MARCRLCKVQGVFPIALSFLLILSVAWAPAAPPTPTSGPEGQTFSFPWPPDWVARGEYRFKPGHPAPSMTCREGLTALPGQRQLVNL